MSEWQPIETAPKDETSLIVAAGGCVGEANYKDYGGSYRAGWYWINTYPGEDEPIDPQPTHWMPFPAPPAVDAVARPLANDSRNDPAR